MSAPAPAAPARAIVCMGARGGCGTSLVAGGIALALAAAGRRCLLADLDPIRGDIAPSWSVPAKRSVADLVRVGDELAPAHLRGAAFPHPSGVAVLAAPPSGIGATATATFGERLLRAAADEWDAVVADLGAGAGRLAAGAVAAAERVVLVSPPSLQGARRARRIAGDLDALGARAATRVVLSPVEPASELSARAFSRSAGLPVATLLPRSPREAPDLLRGDWRPARRRRLTSGIAALAEALA